MKMIKPIKINLKMMLVWGCFLAIPTLLFLVMPIKSYATSTGLCSDTSKWGIHNGTNEWTAGLVVYTEDADGKLGGIDFILSSLSAPDIGQTNPANPNDTVYFNSHRVSSFSLKTGTGDINQDVGDTSGRFWCALNWATYDSDKGVAVFGYGSAYNYGNYRSLSCRIDNNLSNGYETFKISNLPVSLSNTPGYWTGQLQNTLNGSDTFDGGFQLKNGDTAIITLTWHPQPIPTLTPTPTPTPTLTPTPICPTPIAVPNVRIECPYCQ